MIKPELFSISTLLPSGIFIPRKREGSLPLSLLILSFIIFIGVANAQQGKNGAKTIDSTNQVVNEYTFLTANAIAGDTFIDVSNSAINSDNRFTTGLSQGDLVMIIQVQGATIKGNINDSTWGTIISYNNCGLYEFAEVAGVPNGQTIILSAPLINNYSDSGSVEVVRVPRYTSLTINSNDTLTCDAWNGSTGGIVALEIQGNTVINAGGAINASLKGFRGGPTNTGSNYGADINTVYAATYGGGAKGEGIAGYNTAYNALGGWCGRGAPANGGGGGNSWNTPGGGGANAGNINAYTGNGNPDITTNPSWISAWNLEYNGFANSTSSGGGRGGYSAASANLNPLVVGPNNTSWDPNYHRCNTGGKGGRPLDYSTGRIFFGGGGGGGHEDNNDGGNGGAGGGIVYILSYETISGAGSIISNGQNGQEDLAINYYGDGAGGGGGGGAVIINSCEPVSGISIYANGGAGGNQVISNSPVAYESEGGGGGGGGGYIAAPNGAVTVQVQGGLNGTTDAVSMENFLPDGGTKGGNGLQIVSITASVDSNVTICTGDSAQLSAVGGTTYLWLPDTTLSCSGCPDPVAYPLVTTTYEVTIANGQCTYNDTVMVSVLPKADAGSITATPDSVCSGGLSQLDVTGVNGNIQWQVSADGISFVDIPGQTFSSYSAAELEQSTYYRVVATATCGTDSSPARLVTVFPSLADGAIVISPNPICAGDSSQLSVTGITGTAQWQVLSSPGTFTNIPGADSLTYVTPALSQTTNYRLVYGNGVCEDTSFTFTVLISPSPPPPVLTATDSLICPSDSALISVAGSYASYIWNTGSRYNYTFATNAGGYWVTVTEANGCSAVSGHLNINTYPIPSVSIIVQGDTLASYNSSGYQWFFNGSIIPGATGSVYVCPKSGNYSVEISDTDGCVAMSNNVQVVVSGINELSDNLIFTIYPNPFTDDIFIRMNDNTAIIEEIQIYNVLGQLILSKQTEVLGRSFLSLNVAALTPGIYFVRVRANGANYLVKTVKE